MNIDDHPTGSVAAIVARELREHYHLDSIPIEPGDVCLDIGAHVGIVSIYMASRGATVYAFEPVAENYARLKRNLAANDVTAVKAFNVAVSGNGRKLRIAGDLASNSGGSSAFCAQARDGMGTRVKSVTLKDIFTKLGPERVKVLKIDCEGAEYEILGSAPELLERVDYLVGEFHANAYLASFDCTPEALLGWLKHYVAAERISVVAVDMAE